MTSTTIATLSSLITNLRNRLGDTSFWTDDELVYAINESFRTWNLLTGDWADRAILSTNPLTPWITLPVEITSATRIEFRGTSLKKTSLSDLDNGIPGWETTFGTPRYWAPVALNLIAIYPISVVEGFTVDGIFASPVPLVEEETIALERSLYETLLNYARHLLLFKLGGEEWEASKDARKTLWEAAGGNNQKIQASSPYRLIMGFPLDSDQTPYRSGEKKVGLR